MSKNPTTDKTNGVSRYVVVGAMALLVWIIWLSYVGPSNAIGTIATNWRIAFTMVFGSIIAGGTSIGGGAVAFPVFTKVLHIPPPEARVFALAIQSVGMMAATVAITLAKIKVEWRAVWWAGLGGAPGVVFALAVIAPSLPAPITKMSFTMMLATFAVTLFVLNWGHRQTHELIPVFGAWERTVLIISGFAGGIMSGLVGNGIDIVVFSVLVLLFRLSEKVSTPTSVILMGMNAFVGFLSEIFIFREFAEPVIGYWLAAVPIVVVGAPLGAMLCDLLKRETIANVLIFLIGVELISSLILIKLSFSIMFSAVGVMCFCAYMNYLMYRSDLYTRHLKALEEDDALPAPGLES